MDFTSNAYKIQNRIPDFPYEGTARTQKGGGGGKTGTRYY